MKRPSFQFYPGDYLRDAGLRSCSVGARGLWMDMLCHMHDGNPYGYLKVGDKVILPSNLARMVGATLPEIEGWLEELKHADVFSVDGLGCIFSRRMVRDEELRLKRSAGGVLGGNPALLNGHLKDNHKVNLKPNLEPTPAVCSLQSSSANAITEYEPYRLRLCSIMGRRPTTPWSDKEVKGFKAIKPGREEFEEELKLMEWFYSIPSTMSRPVYRRQALVTLLNNWQGDLDKARSYKNQPEFSRGDSGI